MQRMDPSVGDIAGMADPVLRNLWITQRYHEFAVALRDAGLGEDATWCAFAVWASKTAGATIRGEVLPARAKQLLLDNEATQAALHRFNHGLVGRAVQNLTHVHLDQLVEGVTGDVSRQIAAGNVLVFAELAPIFADLLHAYDLKPASAQELAAAITPALASLGTGADAASAATAFDSYGRALFAPAERATLILQANILAVAHEQRRLQPAISGALNAAISDTLKKLVEDDIVRHIPTATARHALDGLTDDLCKVLDEAWDTALTESIMQLVTASETFDLRRDVPPLPDGMFPSGLRKLNGTAAESAFAQWDKTAGSGAPSGAHDWAVLDERMNFIVILFRSRQNDGSLFDPPFTATQLAEMAQGQLPPGPL
jgi:hypothetical protein